MPFPSVAVKVTVISSLTFEWLTLIVADVLPAGIVTDAGRVAADALELDSSMVIPPVGAGPVKVTVPITFVAELPFTDPGETEMDARLRGLTVSVAC